MGLFTQPAGGLVNEPELVIVNAHRADRAFAEVEDFMAHGRAFAGDGGHLVVAVQMVLVGPVTEFHTFEQLFGDVRVAGGGEEGREPVQAGEDAVLNGVRRDVAGPAQDAGNTEAAFEDRPFGLRERRVAAIGPGEEFGAVVGGEDDDGVVVLADVLELLEHQSDVVIELVHAGFLFRPAILRVARRVPFLREMGDDVHAGRVEPDEEGLVVGFGLIYELQGEIADFVVHGFHALGIKCAGVLDLLLADLAPARHLGRVVHVGRPGMNHVARADDVQQILGVVGMRRVFHRVQVVQVAEELVEAVDGGQEFIEVAEVILAELAGGVAQLFERGGNRAGFGRDANLGARLADGGHAGANGQLAHDEVRPSRRAARLGVVVGEEHSLLGELIEGGRSAGHHAPVVGADVPHANVIAHDEEDVGLLVRCVGRAGDAHERRCGHDEQQAVMD